MGEAKRRKTADPMAALNDAETQLLVADIALSLPTELPKGVDEKALMASASRFAALNRRDGRLGLEKIAPKTPADKVLALLGLTRGLIFPRTEQANAHLLKEKPAECAIGCAACCHRPVSVTIPEAIVLAMALVTEDDPRRQRVRDAAADMAARPNAERFARPLRCPFLGDDDKCSVYDLRPVVCRGYASDSRAKCAEAFDNFAAGETEGATVTPQTMPHLLGRANVAALQGLCKDVGVQSDLVILAEAVGAILADPAIIDRWSAGETVFDAAAPTRA